MSNNETDGIWISISDLMSGLMVIFLFIAIAYMYEMQQVMQGVIYITEGFEDTEKSLFNELNNEFKNDLEDWNATIDAKSLSVIFKEPDVLFQKGKHEIKPKFQRILDDFFPRYTKVLNDEQFKKNILGIRIEGHTSSEWRKSTPDKQKYLLNMALSQERASEVLHYVLDTNLNGSYPWVRKRLQAVGYSSSKTKYFVNGKEDKQLSRRVEFRVVTNTHEKLYELVSIVNGKDA